MSEELAEKVSWCFENCWHQYVIGDRHLGYHDNPECTYGQPDHVQKKTTYFHVDGHGWIPLPPTWMRRAGIQP